MDKIESSNELEGLILPDVDGEDEIHDIHAATEEEDNVTPLPPHSAPVDNVSALNSTGVSATFIFADSISADSTSGGASVPVSGTASFALVEPKDLAADIEISSEASSPIPKIRPIEAQALVFDDALSRPVTQAPPQENTNTLAVSFADTNGELYEGSLQKGFGEESQSQIAYPESSSSKKKVQRAVSMRTSSQYGDFSGPAQPAPTVHLLQQQQKGFYNRRIEHNHLLQHAFPAGFSLQVARRDVGAFDYNHDTRPYAVRLSPEKHQTTQLLQQQELNVSGSQVNSNAALLQSSGMLLLQSAGSLLLQQQAHQQAETTASLSHSQSLSLVSPSKEYAKKPTSGKRNGSYSAHINMNSGAYHGGASSSSSAPRKSTSLSLASMTSSQQRRADTLQHPTIQGVVKGTRAYLLQQQKQRVSALSHKATAYTAWMAGGAAVARASEDAFGHLYGTQTQTDGDYGAYHHQQTHHDYDDNDTDNDDAESDPYADCAGPTLQQLRRLRAQQGVHIPVINTSSGSNSTSWALMGQKVALHATIPAPSQQLDTTPKVSDLHKKSPLAKTNTATSASGHSVLSMQSSHPTSNHENPTNSSHSGTYRQPVSPPKMVFHAPAKLPALPLRSVPSSAYLQQTHQQMLMLSSAMAASADSMTSTLGSPTQAQQQERYIMLMNDSIDPHADDNASIGQRLHLQPVHTNGGNALRKHPSPLRRVDSYSPPHTPFHGLEDSQSSHGQHQCGSQWSHSPSSSQMKSHAQSASQPLSALSVDQQESLLRREEWIMTQRAEETAHRTWIARGNDPQRNYSVHAFDGSQSQSQTRSGSQWMAEMSEAQWQSMQALQLAVQSSSAQSHPQLYHAQSRQQQQQQYERQRPEQVTVTLFSANQLLAYPPPSNATTSLHGAGVRHNHSNNNAHVGTAGTLDASSSTVMNALHTIVVPPPPSTAVVARGGGVSRQLTAPQTQLKHLRRLILLEVARAVQHAFPAYTKYLPSTNISASTHDLSHKINRRKHAHRKPPPAVKDETGYEDDDGEGGERLQLLVRSLEAAGLGSVGLQVWDCQDQTWRPLNKEEDWQRGLLHAWLYRHHALGSNPHNVTGGRVEYEVSVMYTAPVDLAAQLKRHWLSSGAAVSSSAEGEDVASASHHLSLVALTQSLAHTASSAQANEIKSSSRRQSNAATAPVSSSAAASVTTYTVTTAGQYVNPSRRAVTAANILHNTTTTSASDLEAQRRQEVEEANAQAPLVRRTSSILYPRPQHVQQVKRQEKLVQETIPRMQQMAQHFEQQLLLTRWDA